MCSLMLNVFALHLNIVLKLSTSNYYLCALVNDVNELLSTKFNMVTNSVFGRKGIQPPPCKRRSPCSELLCCVHHLYVLTWKSSQVGIL